MKKFLWQKEIPLHKIFRELKKRKEANLGKIADICATLYMQNHYFSRECEYIKYLKEFYLFINLFIHLGNNKKRRTHFQFDKELVEINKLVNKNRKIIYKKWEQERFEDEVKRILMIKKKSAKDILYLEFIEEYIPFNFEDKANIKKDLGIIR